MEQIILQILRESAVAGLAVFMFYMYKQSWELRMKDKDEMVACLKADRDEMAGLLKENSEVVARNTQAFEDLQITLNRINGTTKA